jgi:FtsH-binding integral membrane protein
MGGHVVIPLLAVALAALLVILIFQRRDKDLPKSSLGIVGVIFNFLIALTVLPFATIYAIFSDINGSSAEFLHQLGYVIPAIIVLALAASVSLRRRGYQKSSFAVQFIGPAVFGLLILCLYITYGYG